MTLYCEPCLGCGALFHEEVGSYLVGEEHLRTCGDRGCSSRLLKLVFLRDEVADGERTEFPA